MCSIHLPHLLRCCVRLQHAQSSYYGNCFDSRHSCSYLRYSSLEATPIPPTAKQQASYQLCTACICGTISLWKRRILFWMHAYQQDQSYKLHVTAMVTTLRQRTQDMTTLLQRTQDTTWPPFLATILQCKRISTNYLCCCRNGDLENMGRENGERENGEKDLVSN